MPARLFGYVVGVIYLIVGVTGFLVTGVHAYDLLTEPHTGHYLMGFELNGLHNFVHLFVGSALLVAAADTEVTAQIVVLAVSAVYGLVGIVGFFALSQSWNILAVNMMDNFLHLATAAAGVGVVLLSRREAMASI